MGEWLLQPDSEALSDSQLAVPQAAVAGAVCGSYVSSLVQQMSTVSAEDGQVGEGREGPPGHCSWLTLSGLQEQFAVRGLAPL